MSYTNSGMKQSRAEERENKRMAQLSERARKDPAVHQQLVNIMEEDPKLVKAFSKHVEGKYGSKWNEMSSTEKTNLIKSEIAKNRIPTKRGGRRTKKMRKTKRSKLGNRKTKKTKTKRRNTRKKTTRKRR